MIKKNYITIKLETGESFNREDFQDCTGVLVIKGCIVIFNSQGKIVFHLCAGEVNLFDAKREFTGTAMEDTELIIV